MPGDDDASDHRGQLPPFSPVKFNWNQDNLYEQFRSFKRVVELHSRDSMKSAQMGSSVV